jgi:hypothetical protein
MFDDFSVCNFSGFYSSVAEDSVLGYDTAMMGNQMPTFRGNSIIDPSFEDEDAPLF